MSLRRPRWIGKQRKNPRSPLRVLKAACYTECMTFPRFLQPDPKSLLAMLALMVLSVCTLSLPVQAQTTAAGATTEPHDPSKSMLPDARGAVPWSLLTTATIRMSKGKLGPAFPEALRPLNGKMVKLQGYILPIEAGQTHRYFLLSAWSPTCPFCQTAGPEAVVEVRARSAVKYSTEPVVVEGRLMLLENDASGVFYRLIDAAPANL